jgi:hypothetical protein
MRELKVSIGDIIRSYDFKPMHGRDDCFVEGMVIEQDVKETIYDCWKIRVTKDSWSDSEDKGRFGKIVYVPKQVSYNDYPGRVMNLSRI